MLCGVDMIGDGKFTLDAINAICDAMTKSSIQSLRCSLFIKHVQYGYPPFPYLTLVACTCGSLATNRLVYRGDASAVIKLAEAFTQMPNLRKVK